MIITVDGSYTSEEANTEAASKGLPLQLVTDTAWGLVATGVMNENDMDDDDVICGFGGTLPVELGSKPHTSSLYPEACGI